MLKQLIQDYPVYDPEFKIFFRRRIECFVAYFASVFIWISLTEDSFMPSDKQLSNVIAWKPTLFCVLFNLECVLTRWILNYACCYAQ